MGGRDLAPLLNAHQILSLNLHAVLNAAVGFFFPGMAVNCGTDITQPREAVTSLSASHSSTRSTDV